MHLRALILCIAVAAVPTQLPAQQVRPSEAVENLGSGSINWTTGQVSATGIGAPPARAANAAQARAMAVRAAQVVAYRNLLEIVKGVRVDSETVVENFMTKSDVIRTQVGGIVQGAMVVDTKYLSDGSVEVTVAMGMKGALMNTLLPPTFGAGAPSSSGLTGSWPGYAPAAPSPAPSAKPQQPQQPVPQQTPEKRMEPARPEPPRTAPATPPAPERKPEPPQPAPAQPAPSSTTFQGGVATGVVIDGRGLGLKPALLPKILDAQGQEIYVGQVVPRTNAVEQGVAGYAKDVNAAANNFRVTDNPAVIKGYKAAGTARTDIMLSQGDAQMLRDLGKRGDFLQYCRVIIVY